MTATSENCHILEMQIAGIALGKLRIPQKPIPTETRLNFKISLSLS